MEPYEHLGVRYELVDHHRRKFLRTTIVTPVVADVPLYDESGKVIEAGDNPVPQKELDRAAAAVPTGFRVLFEVREKNWS